MKKQSDIKIINIHQQEYYEEVERRSVEGFMKLSSTVLEKMKNRDNLKILDIGGASGYFAMTLHEYFFDKNCEIFVLDTTRYGTWEQYADRVTFIEGSADDLSKLFELNTFDLVFANRVFHHFVRDSWKKSISGMLEIMKQIASILKEDGSLCVIDLFYNGMVYDRAPSKIIYKLTSCTLPAVVFFCKKFGAESAGIGVCFLSKKMWINLFHQADFIIETLEENTKNMDTIKWYKRLCLFIKKASENNVFVLRPQNH
jgi:ubiquinone/menaquinone biosynthesis C-methylase UbiE